jgi:DEAD/DEAH box helicase domain-containing protein
MSTTRNIVYFDLETQRLANDVGGWDRKQDMGMSIGVTYSTKKGGYTIYPEGRVDELIRELIEADVVVGYNVLNFDYAVLMGYTVLDLTEQLATLDMLVEVEKVVGARLPLETLAKATLGVGKIAHGLDAVKWWREGRVMEIAEYCCFDVKVTKLVHEYAAKHGELYYIDRFNRKQRIALDVVKAPSLIS